MDLTIHTTFLPHDEPDASVAFYRDTLGFDVRTDVGEGKMRWIMVGPPDQPNTSSWRRAHEMALRVPSNSRLDPTLGCVSRGSIAGT